MRPYLKKVRSDIKLYQIPVAQYFCVYCA